MPSRDRRKYQYHITNANSSQKKKKKNYKCKEQNHLELKRELEENLILLTLMNLFKAIENSLILI